MYLKLKPKDLRDPPSIYKDLSTTGHFGTGDAEFSIKHNMESRLYKIQHCPFCGEELNNEEMEDEIEFDDFDE